MRVASSRSAITRNHAAVASRRHRNLTDVQIPVGICPHVMWGKEISHGTRVGAAAPPGQELAFLVENAQAGADGITIHLRSDRRLSDLLEPFAARLANPVR